MEDIAKIKNIPEGCTEAMIKAWWAKYGKDNVKPADLPKGDTEADGFLSIVVRIPTRRIKGQFEKFIDRDPAKAKEILVKACVLTHKDEVLADDGLFEGAVDAIVELIPVRKAIIKNF